MCRLVYPGLPQISLSSILSPLLTLLSNLTTEQVLYEEAIQIDGWEPL